MYARVAVNRKIETEMKHKIKQKVYIYIEQTEKTRRNTSRIETKKRTCRYAHIVNIYIICNVQVQRWVIYIDIYGKMQKPKRKKKENGK